MGQGMERRPQALHLDQARRTDPRVNRTTSDTDLRCRTLGDVGYYAPGNDLVLYYGDQSYYPGIVILGRLNGDTAHCWRDLPARQQTSRSPFSRRSTVSSART
ncbi:MAG TPA: cyclophilin-like fold protein [Dermatophilaceae bacterium]